MTDRTSETSSSAGVVRTAFTAPGIVKIMLAGDFANQLGSFIMPFLVIFATSIGLSPFESSGALALYGAGSALGIAIGGRWGDRITLRTMCAVSLGGRSVALLLLAISPWNHSILLWAALAGLLGQLYRPISTTWISTLTADDDQMAIFAIQRFIFNVGSVAAPLLAAGAIQLTHGDYRLMIIWDAGATLLQALIGIIALPPRTRLPHKTEERANPFRVLSGDRPYIAFLASVFLSMLVYVQFMTILPLDVSAHRPSLLLYTAILTINATLVIAIEIPITAKVKSRAPLQLIKVGYVVTAAGVLAYALPFSTAALLAGTLIWTVGEILGGPSSYTFAAARTTGPDKQYFIASFQLATSLAWTVGPAVGGIVWAASGHSGWLIIGALQLLAAGLIWQQRSTTASPTDQS